MHPHGGCTLERGGQSEYRQRAEEKQMVVVPVIFGLIMVMQPPATRSFRDVVLIATGMPPGWLAGSRRGTNLGGKGRGGGQRPGRPVRARR
ncbi:MAG: hypothetical protein U1F77_13605 [Kiritimatiellia bacterium]